MSEWQSKEEYVLNDQGLIWRGTHNQMKTTHWNFAQVGGCTVKRWWQLCFQTFILFLVSFSMTHHLHTITLVWGEHHRGLPLRSLQCGQAGSGRSVIWATIFIAILSLDHTSSSSFEIVMIPSKCLGTLQPLSTAKMIEASSSATGERTLAAALSPQAGTAVQLFSSNSIAPRGRSSLANAGFSPV